MDLVNYFRWFGAGRDAALILVFYLRRAAISRAVFEGGGGRRLKVVEVTALDSRRRRAAALEMRRISRHWRSERRGRCKPRSRPPSPARNAMIRPSCRGVAGCHRCSPGSPNRPRRYRRGAKPEPRFRCRRGLDHRPHRAIDRGPQGIVAGPTVTVTSFTRIVIVLSLAHGAGTRRHPRIS